MKRFLVLSAVFCLLSLSAIAQDKVPSFSGEWTLDKSKSTMTGRMMSNVESMTITVNQSDKEIKTETKTKRAMGGPGSPGGPPPGAGGPPPGGGGPPMGGGGGRGPGGPGMGGPPRDAEPMTYKLDGKENKTEVNGGGGVFKSTAKIEGGKLHLSVVRTFQTQMGEISMSTNEVWEIQTDGSLKIKRDNVTPRGTESSELIFTKKQ